MRLRALDHLVLTVADIASTVRFYEDVLGMEHRVSAEGRHSLHFGRQKINLHERGREFDPKAALPTPGSGDLCFLTDTLVGAYVDHLRRLGLEPLEGPVERTGAEARLLSVYVRDPDGNLIEVANEIG